MQDPDLDKLLRKWATAEADADATRDCPTLSILWYHESDGQDLGQHAEHVPDCPRCQKRLALIRTELAHTRGLRVVGGGRRAFIPTMLKVGAVAASIALVFTLWSTADAVSFDADIALFASSAYSIPDAGATRGHTATPSATVEPELDWVAQALSDESVQAAVTSQRETLGEILFELSAVRLTFDAERGLAVAPTIDEPTARALGLFDFVTTDREATERIVDALVRTLPGASPDHRSALRRALYNWRMKNVFGQSTATGALPPTGH